MKKVGLLVILILVSIIFVGVPSPVAPAGDPDLVWQTTIFPEPHEVIGEVPEVKAENFGESIAVGDVNGDGFDDIIVLSDYFVYVYEGPSEATAEHPLIMMKIDLHYGPYSNHGCDLAVADVNNDHIMDIIVGFYSISNENGWVYAFYGRTEWTTPDMFPLELDLYDDCDWSAGSPSNAPGGGGGKFGFSVAKAGDLNANGVDGIIVGAPAEDGNGKAYVYYGSTVGLPADLQPDAIIPMSDTWELWQNGIEYRVAGGLGTEVAKDGHFVNPPYTSDNFIIGIPGADIDFDGSGSFSETESDVGVALLGPRWWCLSGDNVHHSNFGFSLGNAGDVNYDGHPDVLICARNSSYSLFTKAFLYLGDSDRVDTTEYAWSVEGFNYRTWAPNPVGSAGDINGDGYDDIYIGEPIYDPDSSYGADGRVCIWYGGSSTPLDPSGLGQNPTPETADVILDPYDIGTFSTISCIEFGYEVASGDINGDGLSDIVIADPETYHPEGGTDPGVKSGSVTVYLSGFSSPVSGSYLVVRGLNNRIYYRSYADDVWGSWKVVPSGTTCDSPAAVVYNGKLYLVVRSMDGNGLYFGSVDLGDDSFSGWDWISGSTPSAPMLACYDNGNGLVLVVRGGNDRIYYRLYSCVSDEWDDWVVIPRGQTCDTPAAIVKGNYLYLVVRGMTGHGLYHKKLPLTRPPDSLGWDLGSGDTPSTPTIANDDSGFYLIVRGMDDTIYYKIWSGGWPAHFTKIPEATTHAREYGPAAVILENKLHLVVVSTNTNLYHGNLDLETDVWDDWDYISGLTQSTPTLTN